MLTTDGRGGVAGRPAKKRKSLFDPPAPRERGLPAVVQRIRSECADLLHRVFGGAPKEEEKADGAPHEEEEATAAETQAAPLAAESSEDATEAPAAPAPAAEPAAAALADSDDEIVPVTKKARWTKDKKRARKTAAPAADIAPFDYAGARSVLDAAPAPERTELLGARAPRGKKDRAPAPALKGAKRKNDMRSSNKSATFGRNV